MIDAGLIEERPWGEEPLGRLWLTEQGARALAGHPEGAADV